MNSEEESRLVEKLIQHDWYYEYSDDYSVWSEGKSEIEHIVKIMHKANLDEKQLTQLRNKVLSIVSPNNQDHRYISIWYERFEFLKKKIYNQQAIVDSLKEV